MNWEKKNINNTKFTPSKSFSDWEMHTHCNDMKFEKRRENEKKLFSVKKIDRRMNKEKICVA
jgi:hypothetical protein